MLNVMLVDNEANILKGLRCCVDWCELNCTVAATAQNGAEALALLETMAIDIVVTDIKMPGINGLELAQTLRRDYPQIQVIILTGFPDFSYAQQAIACDVADFVLKPTNAQSLRQAVIKAAGNIQKERGTQQAMVKLRSAEQENLYFRQNMLLQKLIFGLESSLIFTLEQSVKLSLDLSGYSVVCFAVYPASEEDDSDFDFTPYLERAESLLLQTFHPYSVRFVRKGSRYGYAIVLCKEPPAAETRCMEIRSISSSLFDFGLSFGVSAFHTLPTELKLAASEASYAQSFDVSSSGTGVMGYSNIPNMPSANLDILTAAMRQLRTAVENNMSGQTQSIFQNICSVIAENDFSMTEAIRIHALIYNSCLTALYERNLNGSEQLKREILTVEAALQNESYDSICSAMPRFLDFAQKLIHSTSQDTDSIVLSVQNIINQRYAENITLKYLADTVHLSPSYLSKLFKKQIGQNICTYIQATRVEHAKLLLQMTHKKNHQIAEEIGIEDPVYFSKVFKRFTGLKPQEYRNRSGGQP